MGKTFTISQVCLLKRGKEERRGKARLEGLPHMPLGVGGGAWHKYSEKQGDRDGPCGGHLFCLLWRPCDLPKSLSGGEASLGGAE